MPQISETERERLQKLRDRFGQLTHDREPGIIPGFQPVEPMLAETIEQPLDRVTEADWYAETKYDGTRLILEKFDDEVNVYTRRNVERAASIPSVIARADSLPNDIVLDGELVFIGPDGRDRFIPIHTSREILEKQELRPRYMVFDLLYDQGDCTQTPLGERKQRLDDLITDTDELMRTPYHTTDFPGFFRSALEEGREGIMLKRRNSWYYPGIRSRQWLKVKGFGERDAIVIGYTNGEGYRDQTFGALVLSDGERYIGKVGSGFTDADLETLVEQMTPRDQYPFSEDVVGVPYTPVEPFVITVKYQELSRDKKLRAPVFLRARPDKPIADVETVP